MSDFGNITALVGYLLYLTANETAYEEHRQWRHSYNVENNIRHRPLLSDSWFCRVCKWAANQTVALAASPEKQLQRLVSRPSCVVPNVTVENTPSAALKAPAELNGKAVRGSSRQVYLVRNGVLHAVPDLATFQSLKLDLEKIVQLDDGDMRKYLHGEPLPRAV